MPEKKYIVELTIEERKQLERLIRKGKVAGYKIRHAQMLLKADADEHGPAWDDARIAEAFGAGRATVERLRKRLVERGLESALERQKRAPQIGKFDGEAEAHLIAIACSKAPEGSARWTLRLLADKVVELGIVESCSHMTIQRTLKKKYPQTLANGPMVHPGSLM